MEFDSLNIVIDFNHFSSLSHFVTFNYSFSDEELFKTAVCMHLLHYVATAHKLPLDVNLRDRWPVGISLDLFSKDLVLQAINVLELFDAVKLKYLDHIIREPTARHLSVTLHEKTNVVL